MGAISQGAVYWADLPSGRGSVQAGRRPVVVVQNDAINSSRISTTIVCALTTNIRRAAAPGNVWVRAGEANLPKDSVVNVSQVQTVDKSALAERLGQLSRERVTEIVAGLRQLTEPTPGSVSAELDVTDVQPNG